MDAAIQVVQFYEANYPEYLRRVFVINGRWRGGGKHRCDPADSVFDTVSV